MGAQLPAHLLALDAPTRSGGPAGPGPGPALVWRPPPAPNAACSRGAAPLGYSLLPSARATQGPVSGQSRKPPVDCWPGPRARALLGEELRGHREASPPAETAGPARAPGQASWFWPLCSVERDVVARLQGTLVGKTGTWRRRPRNPAASSPAQGPRGPTPAPCRSAALVRLLGCSSSPPKPAFLWLPAPPWLPGPLSPAPRSSVPPLITPGPQRGLCSPSPGV